MPIKQEAVHINVRIGHDAPRSAEKVRSGGLLGSKQRACPHSLPCVCPMLRYQASASFIGLGAQLYRTEAIAHNPRFAQVVSLKGRSPKGRQIESNSHIRQWNRRHPLQLPQDDKFVMGHAQPLITVVQLLPDPPLPCATALRHEHLYAPRPLHQPTLPHTSPMAILLISLNRPLQSSATAWLIWKQT